MFGDSEERRGLLQISIVKTSQKIVQDTHQHEQYQNTLIQENDALKAKI